MRLPPLNQPPPATDAQSPFDEEIITLTNIAPVFMAGALNPRKETGKLLDSTPELRAPSIVGSLRFWYRALAGSQIGADLETLRSFETRTFGGTEQASPFRLQVKKLRQTISKEALVTYDDDTPDFASDRGFQGNLGLVFKLTIQFLIADVRIRQQIRDSLYLLLSLGGIGRRSRRGFGSLIDTGGNHEPTWENLDNLITTEEFITKCQNQLLTMQSREIWSGITYKPFDENGRTLPSYPILHPNHCKILVGIGTTGSEGYFNKQAMMAFWTPLREKKAESEKFKQATFLGSIEKKGESDSKRRASAFHLSLRAFRVNENSSQVFPILTVFRTNISDQWHLAQEFIDEFKETTNAQYIWGGEEENRWDE